MIVTLTANPSLDRAISLAAPLRPGQVQTALGGREDAGGKGINVSRVVALAGEDTQAVLPLSADDPYRAVLDGAGITYRAVGVDGHVRSNLTIVDADGETTKLNLPGTALDAAQRQALIDAVVAASAGADWLVLAGSLPPGAGDAFYVDVIRAVRAGSRPPRIAVDTSDAALRAVVAEGAPDLIKPNEDELAELAGIPLDEGVDLVAAVLPVARSLVPARVGAALVTLGAAGAVLVTADGAWAGRPPRIRVVSTVGAGDSSLAGFVLAAARGASPAEALRQSIRYGAAAASLPGTQAPRPLDLPQGDVPVRSL
ncbi:1-phosphofructokinase family hexose kinase [Microbacterium sp. SORGH_AS_0888]|uniref:1-phosphofructokinase family hexose kinase n=1 Tax=Microbacterium sp. SORGH_AS_0888 TaxID=3041791 RepID=UPI00278B86E0|nr:1-phosphofructokinase family hexose kinase [Microbacterium sp. SORGH_AS_0888]MDQ1128355.1 1-phosphofructokinase [Microbacterium sp. SORGH_AS_0888]